MMPPGEGGFSKIGLYAETMGVQIEVSSRKRHHQWPVPHLAGIGSCHQSTVTVSFVLPGCTPSVSTLDPAHTISVINSSDFLAERDIDFSCMHSKNSQVHHIMVSNSLLAIPESSTISSILILGSRSPRFSMVTKLKVAGDPVSPNGICFWVRKLLLSV